MKLMTHVQNVFLRKTPVLVSDQNKNVKQGFQWYELTVPKVPISKNDGDRFDLCNCPFTGLSRKQLLQVIAAF